MANYRAIRAAEFLVGYCANVLATPRRHAAMTRYIESGRSSYAMLMDLIRTPGTEAGPRSERSFCDRSICQTDRFSS